MKKRLFVFALVVLLLCSVAMPVFASSNGNTIVYRTVTGECYHLGSCSYLRSSKFEITLAEAVARGLRPCSRCNPPRYVAAHAAKQEPDSTPAPTRAYSGAYASSQSIANVGDQIDLSEFKEQQKKDQAEFESMKKQIEESKKFTQSIEKIKTPEKVNSVSDVGSKIICILLGIWSIIFIGRYLYEKIRKS